MKKIFTLLTVLFLSVSAVSFAQNVNVAPNPATYADLTAAFGAINGGLHGAGAVTVSIVGDFVQAAQANLNGGVFTSCSITPNGARTITANFNGTVINLNGADNVTIDGLNTGGNSLTITNSSTGTNANGVQFANGATFNVIRNTTLNGPGASGATAGGRGVAVGQSVAGTSGNNDNLIENNVTNGFRRGIQNFGTAGLFINERTTIKNNKVKNFTGLGIFVGSEVAGNIVEGNEVFYDAAVPNDAAGVRGINIQGCGTSVVTRNKVYSLSGTVAGGFIGLITIPIKFTAPIVTPATTIDVYNNMFALNNCIVSAPFIYGMYIASNPSTTNYNANIAFNSALIAGSSGTTSAADNEAIVIGVDGAAGPSTVQYYNNVAQNARTGGDTLSLNLGHQLIPATGVTLLADYNVAYSYDTAAATGWDAAYNGSVYRNFGGQELYKDSTCTIDIEQNTAFIPVPFVSATDLHLNTSFVGFNMDATPLAAVSADFDGNSRAISGSNPFSYRGCDEVAGGKKSYDVLFKLEGTTGFPYRAYIGLRNSASPYAALDYAFRKVSSISGGASVSKLNSGPFIASASYYIEVITKHSIRTQSKNPVSFAAASGTYNFTTAATQAYGDNMVLDGALYALYNGDANQDDFVDVTDVAEIDNDVFNFVAGCYHYTDVNDDGLVDITDLGIADNNGNNFVGAVLLPGTEPGDARVTAEKVVTSATKGNVKTISKIQE